MYAHQEISPGSTLKKLFLPCPEEINTVKYKGVSRETMNIKIKNEESEDISEELMTELDAASEKFKKCPEKAIQFDTSGEFFDFYGLKNASRILNKRTRKHQNKKTTAKN